MSTIQPIAVCLPAQAASPPNSSLDAFEVTQNQFRQIAAVAAFKKAEERNSHGAQFLPQPEEIFGQQSPIGERVTAIRIEPRGNGDESGRKVFNAAQRAAQNCTPAFARSGWLDRIIETIIAHVLLAG